MENIIEFPLAKEIVLKPCPLCKSEKVVKLEPWLIGCNECRMLFGLMDLEKHDSQEELLLIEKFNNRV